jgi:hypothetical protein
VTSVDFHPISDRLFVTGCYDRRLRVWDIIADASSKTSVKHWQEISANDPVRGACMLFLSRRELFLYVCVYLSIYLSINQSLYISIYLSVRVAL